MLCWVELEFRGWVMVQLLWTISNGLGYLCFIHVNCVCAVFSQFTGLMMAETFDLSQTMIINVLACLFCLLAS